MSPFIIGIDESGTGAWAGPFTVAAVVFSRHDVLPGVHDSKAMTDQRRRAALDRIAEIALGTALVFGTVEDFNATCLRETWRRCVEAAVEGCLSAVPPHSKILIDGKGKPWTSLQRLAAGHSIHFEPKADVNHVVVSAASVYAKTARNDAMIKLHDEYPEYGWSKNYGYGTADHRDAIQRHGITVHHRAVQPLRHLKRRST
jgi:ribonuclease HII